MKTVLCHFVQMDRYEVPDNIAEKGDTAIEEFIFNKNLKPVSSDTRDWEIVEVE